MATHAPARSTARRAARSGVLDKAPRLGLIARGLVYALVGVLAFEVAIGNNERTDQKGALEKLAEQPAGALLLWVMAIGFFAYALWQLSEAVQGHRDKRDQKKRALFRFGSAVTGLLYVGFGLLSIKVALGAASSSAQTSWTAKVLNHSGGQALVVVIGLIVLGVGIGMIVMGVRTDFENDLRRGEMGKATYTAVKRLGQIGFLCRGLVIALAGAFVVKAAADHEPGQARGLDVALKSVADAPFGRFLLIAVAVGLVCFGLYSFAEARYRRI